MNLVLLVCAGILSPWPLQAHDFWVRASDYRPAKGDTVNFRLHVGVEFGGEVLPRIAPWIVRFDYQDGSGVHPVPGELGDDPAGHLDSVERVTSVIYQGQRKVVDLGAAKFHSYLREEGLEHILAQRQALGEQEESVREWYSRYAKAILHPRGGEGEAWAFRFGMPLELVPLNDPYALDGNHLRVRLLWQGEPLPDVRVAAYSEGRPKEQLHARTDADGVARLALPYPGLWLVKAVHMLRAPADAKDHQWESFWASLTFETPGDADPG